MNDFQAMMERAGAAFGKPMDLPKIDVQPEPWMKKFVQERHTQEEWDAFFAYCEAGPFKRMMIQLLSLLTF